MTSVLRVENLTKSFARKKAVDSLCFEVNAGEVVAILGPNGSGKTTTIKCIAGLLMPHAGTIAVCGEPIARNRKNALRNISYLPQTAEFPANITALETIRFHARLRGLSEEAAVSALTKCGFAESDFGKSAGHLSGGMRHRLSLAIAGMTSSPLMLLDEPTANLDPAAAQRFRTVAKTWREEGRSILMSTHVLSDVTEIADSVIVMVEGRAVAVESVLDLRFRLNKFARLRVDVGAVTERHSDAAFAAGAVEIRKNGKALVIFAPEDRRLAILSRLEEIGAVNGFETDKPSIEDLYIEYVESSNKAG